MFHYYPSLGKALEAVYPQFNWDHSKFSEGKAPFAREKDQLLLSLSEAEKKLGISKVECYDHPHHPLTRIFDLVQIEDWYSVNITDLKELGFPSKLSKTQLVELLSEKYPEHQWEKAYLLRGRFAQQKRLERAVLQLFKVADLSLVSPSSNSFFRARR